MRFCNVLRVKPKQCLAHGNTRGGHELIVAENVRGQLARRHIRSVYTSMAVKHSVQTVLSRQRHRRHTAALLHRFAYILIDTAERSV
jgi:hypothetical protein